MTTYVNYNPYRLLNELQKQMQHLWPEENTTTSSTANTEQWIPAVDIYETENALVILTELPGLKESDFKLNVENNVLTIAGERKMGEEEKPFTAHRRERVRGQFQRSFTLPSNIDVENVQASYKNGILQTTLPKKAAARPRQITIQVKE